MTTTLAINGGTPVRTQPFSNWPVYGQREEELLLEVLHSGKWGMLDGDKVRTFEQRFASFQEAQHGLCVSNGTVALEIALRALGIGPGDEVITTPYTFVATASAVLMVGALPVFVDIDPDTYTLDPVKARVAITYRTKAILPVHFAGRPADMDAILALADTHKLHVLEDACQAWGAAWQGQRVGALGDLGTFSFQSSKNITAGEGGIIVTNNADLAEMCWSLHNTGRLRDHPWYHHEYLGGNQRMTEWQAAVLLAQLTRLPEQMQMRAANVRYLTAALADVPGLDPLPPDPRVTQHAHHLFLIRYDPAAFGGRSRDEFLAAWQAEGITPTTGGYVSLTRTPAILRTLRERWEITDLPACPHAEHAAENTLWVMQYALLGTARDMDDIVSAARKIQAAWG